MNSEYGTFLVWQTHYEIRDTIEELISEHLPIIASYDIIWSNEYVYNNLYRFYGDRLSTSSIKEKFTPGSFPKFRLIVVHDQDPIYNFRATSQGIELLNINFFDLKQLLRNRLGTKFGIHSSNSSVESNRDLTLLTGLNTNDFIKQKCYIHSPIIRNITGHNGWASIDELFYTLNASENYIVLRGFDNLSKSPISEIDDIDFLATNKQSFMWRSNAHKSSRGNERANHLITIEDTPVHIDIRYLGDNYLPYRLEHRSLKNRVLQNNLIYIPSATDHYYGLLYHILIHKRSLPKKYEHLFSKSRDDLADKLYEYMHLNDMQFVEPLDLTLFFSREIGGNIKFSRDRRLLHKKSITAKLKLLLRKVKLLICSRKRI